MKKVLTIALGVIFLISTLGVFALAKSSAESVAIDKMFASDGKANLENHPIVRRILNRIADRLDLTDEQKSQIRQIFQDARPRVQPLVQQAIATRHDLQEATANGTFNEAQVRVLAERQGRTVGQLIVEKERVKTQIYNVLTPEQRQKVEQMKDRFEQRLRERVMEGF